jgi:hypothetical protein
VPDGAALRVGTLNLASGRGPGGRPLGAEQLAAAVAGLDADVLALQEVDAGQARSGGTDQAAVVAGALGAVDWRVAATLAGTPSPFRGTWTAADPQDLRGPGAPCPGRPTAWRWCPAARCGLGGLGWAPAAPACRCGRRTPPPAGCAPGGSPTSRASPSRPAWTGSP